MMVSSHFHPGSQESVVLTPKRRNPEEVQETCDEVNQDNSGLENCEAEETIENIFDVKDQELIFKSMENKIEDICDDELIFKYIHKKFGTKNRESSQVANAN